MIDNKQKKYFEKKENRYDESLLINPLKHVVEETQLILSELKKRSITKVVDFGSGNGRLTIAMLKENIETTAVDISDNSLSTLLKTAKKIGIRSDLLTTSSKIPHKKWDAIVGCDILHHVSLNSTLSEIRTNLEDHRGLILFSEPNIFNLSWGVFVTLRNTWKVEKGMMQCNYFNFLYELRKNNFKNIILHGYGLFPPIFLNKIPFLQEINYFLGNLPILKLLAYRYIIIAQAT